MNKQAKEMAKDICSPRCFKGELGHCNPTKDCIALKFAENAVEKGYRKESDTAKEILDELYHKKYDDIECQVKDYKMHEEAIMIVCKAILKAINERMKNVAERYGVEVE